MKKYKVAIIGLGNWGKKLLRDFYAKSEILYCVGRGSKINKAWLYKNYPQLEYLTDYEKILVDPNVDIIVIATPISTHFELAKKALLAKKHVFLEKPAANSSNKITELDKLAKKSRRLLFVDHVFRYNPNFSFLKEKLKNKKILSIDTLWLKIGNFNEDIYWNLAYHDFYLMAELMKKVFLEKVSQKDQSENKLDISFKTKTNVNISLHINRKSRENKKIFVVETSDQKYSWERESLYEYKDGKKILLNKDNTQPLPIMIEDFLKQVERGKTGINSYQVFKTVELIEVLKSV